MPFKISLWCLNDIINDIIINLNQVVVTDFDVVIMSFSVKYENKSKFWLLKSITSFDIKFNKNKSHNYNNLRL